MVVFIDTEVSTRTHKVEDHGVVREDGAHCHTHSFAEFNAFVSGSEMSYLCTRF